MQTVVVNLSPADSLLFVEFRRRQDIFAELVKGGVFDLRSGSATIHFDADGILRKIEKNEVVFKT